MAAVAAKLGLPLAPFPRNPAPSPPLSRRRPVRFSNLHRKKRPFPRPAASSLVEAREGEGERLDFTDPELRLVEGLLGVQGRGRTATSQQLKDVEQAVKTLEDIKGVADPTSSSLIEGRWQLIFTTRPGTASPIQPVYEMYFPCRMIPAAMHLHIAFRIFVSHIEDVLSARQKRTFVGVDVFRVFQEVYLRTDDPRVSNIVQFSNAAGELKVEAEATIKDGKRILFRFDRAAFTFRFLPFKVPYPVPFRLLGDEAKGWLDTTYLSQTGNIRISKGNKGTTFVLQKKTDPRQRLLLAISTGTRIKETIDELVSVNQSRTSEESHPLEGEWQLLWASQLEEESWSDTVSAGLKGLQIVRENGKVENSVDLFPGFKLAAYGSFIKSDKSYNVTMSNGMVMIGALKLPLEIKRSYNMQLLISPVGEMYLKRSNRGYIDKKIRITQGYKQSIFVHLRVNRPERN